MSESADTPLIERLGFLPDETVFVQDTPDWYSVFAADNQFELEASIPAAHVHMFCDSKATLFEFLNETDLEDVEKSIWFSWPKQTSKIKTDLIEKTFRDALLPFDWVSTEATSIDDTWNGLRFLRNTA